MRSTWYTPRSRASGGMTPTTQVAVNTVFGPSSPTLIVTNETRRGPTKGNEQSCFDYVTKDFKRRVSLGEVINNPFTHISYTCDGGGLGPLVTYVGSPSWAPGTSKTNDHQSNRHNSDPRYALIPYRDAYGNLTIPSSIVDVPSLITKANTAALAKVDSSTAAGMVTLGEGLKTARTLLNPLQAILKYTRGFANNQRTGRVASRSVLKRRGAGAFEDAPTALANQYLTYYYGLLPFVKDIESILDAYINEGLNPPRRTARSNASDTKLVVENYVGPRNAGSSYIDSRYTREDKVEVRCGILYVPTDNDYQKTLGFRFGDIPGMIHELTPWSFFLGYFSNLGKFVYAMSPRVGVSYLASWLVCDYVMRWRSETIGTGFTGSSFVHSRVGNEWAEMILKATTRTPISPYANVGFQFQKSDWSSVTKCVAVISLITQAIWPMVLRSKQSVASSVPGQIYRS